MAKIFLSIPVLDQPELSMVQSMEEAISTCHHQVLLAYHRQDSLISRVRNFHISKFFYEQKDCDYFFSLDSDIEIVNKYRTNNIFDKLISSDIDFVGGLYSSKSPTSSVCSSIPLDQVNKNPRFDSGLIEMRWLSSGCWCLKRSVIEKMELEYRSELQYDGDDCASGKKIIGIYTPMIIENRNGEDIFRKYLSEDWSFCERWRRIGGKIFADTSVVLRHIGKYPYALWNVTVVKENKTTEKNQQV